MATLSAQLLSPIHRQLSGARLSLAEMADLIERHIGDGRDRRSCKEALDALQRIRRDSHNFYVRAAAAPLDRGGEPCVLVREVVLALRKWHHFSGA